MKTVTVARGNITQYSYDAAGHRTQETDALGHATNFGYDAVGNQLPMTDTNAHTTQYQYDNHLKTQNSGAVTIVYDGDGNRVAKTTGGTTTAYLVDDRNLTGYAQVLEEMSGGAVQRVYTYGLNRISQSQASGTSFYGYDGHGSVRLLTDATGAVTDRYDYDVFGNIISQAETTPNLYLYSGEQNDPNLGLYYLRARYLATGVGRFWVADTFEGSVSLPKSLHGYAYVEDDPVNNQDPSGRWVFVGVRPLNVPGGGFFQVPSTTGS